MINVRKRVRESIAGMLFSAVVVGAVYLVSILSQRDEKVRRHIEENTAVTSSVEQIEGLGVIDVKGQYYLVEPLNLPVQTDEPIGNPLLPLVVE